MIFICFYDCFKAFWETKAVSQNEICVYNHHCTLSLALPHSRYLDEIVAVSHNVLAVTKVKPSKNPSLPPVCAGEKQPKQVGEMTEIPKNFNFQLVTTFFENS